MIFVPCKFKAFLPFFYPNPEFFKLQINAFGLFVIFGLLTQL